MIHEQMNTLNNELLAQQEEKIILEDEIRHWKG